MRNQNNNYLPKNKNLQQRARELRKAGNLSEVLLWLKLKNNQLKGLDFDRQVVIGNYIVDFFCPEAKTVIEIDGGSHDFKGESDEIRDDFLKSLGLNIIRLADKDVRQHMDSVIEYLKANI